MYSRKKDNLSKRFERNYELYKKIIDILILLVINEENIEPYRVHLKKVIQENYSHIYLEFDSELVFDLMSLYNNCESYNYYNMKYYAEKCIRKMRKENENGGWITISQEMGNILKKREVMNDSCPIEEDFFT